MSPTSKNKKKNHHHHHHHHNNHRPRADEEPIPLLGASSPSSDSSVFIKPAHSETAHAERQGFLPPNHHHQYHQYHHPASTTNIRTHNKKGSSNPHHHHPYPSTNTTTTPRRQQFDARLRPLLAEEDETIQEDDLPLDWKRAYWLGMALFLALCVFWILDSLKDPVFGAITGDLERLQPIAKLISVAFTIAIVMVTEHVTITNHHHHHSSRSTQDCNHSSHSKDDTNDDNDPDDDDDDEWILNHDIPWQTIRTETSHEAARRRRRRRQQQFQPNHDNDDNARISVGIFSTIGIPYCIFFGLMAYFLQFNPKTRMMMVHGNTDNVVDDDDNDISPPAETTAMTFSDSSTSAAQLVLWRYLAYAWFAAIESYGSIVVATFWWYVNSTVSLHEAEAFYGIIIGAAQVGALVGSTMVTIQMWTSVTLTISACLIMLLHIIVMQLYDRNFPPTQQQPPPPSLHHHPPPVVAESTDDDERYSHHKHSVGSGLYLILQHNYVLLILGVSCLDEISLTCLNYQMTMIGWAKFDAADFGTFIGRYGQLVNLASIVLSAMVFPRLLRRAGLKWTIRIFPTLLLLINTIAFWVLRGNLLVLFLSMALMKAMTYSIHDPAKELLYIPTSNAIKFKAKFWIDIVGARLAKAIGSSINHIANGNIHQSIRYGSLPSFFTALALWYACAKVGREFETLIDEGTMVGVDDDDHDHDVRRQPHLYYYHNEYCDDNDDDELEKDEYPVGESIQAMELTAI